MSEIEVFYEATPNPQALKFMVTQEICDESYFCENVGAASRSPLAQKIFGFPWTKSVHLGHNFVTITKQEWVDWDVLADPLSNLIREHLERNEGVLSPAAPQATTGEDSPDVQRIKEILDQEIRPAVAMDGGDIVFHSYEDGKLFLSLRGACSGCPSSTMTLKEGIETRLKEALPELNEVIAVD